MGIAKGLIRTVRSSLESRLGARIPDDHPLLSWIVQYSGAMQRRFTTGDDGRVPHERVHGRKCHQPMAEFGERVWWMPLDPGNAQDLPSPGDRFSDGWWVGPVDGQHEAYILTVNGAVRCRTFRRRPFEEFLYLLSALSSLSKYLERREP